MANAHEMQRERDVEPLGRWGKAGQTGTRGPEKGAALPTPGTRLAFAVPAERRPHTCEPRLGTPVGKSWNTKHRVPKAPRRNPTALTVWTACKEGRPLVAPDWTRGRSGRPAPQPRGRAAGSAGHGAAAGAAGALRPATRGQPCVCAPRPAGTGLAGSWGGASASAATRHVAGWQGPGGKTTRWRRRGRGFEAACPLKGGGRGEERDELSDAGGQGRRGALSLCPAAEPRGAGSRARQCGPGHPPGVTAAPSCSVRAGSPLSLRIGTTETPSSVWRERSGAAGGAGESWMDRNASSPLLPALWPPLPAFVPRVGPDSLWLEGEPPVIQACKQRPRLRPGLRASACLARGSCAATAKVRPSPRFSCYTSGHLGRGFGRKSADVGCGVLSRAGGGTASAGAACWRSHHGRRVPARPWGWSQKTGRCGRRDSGLHCPSSPPFRFTRVWDASEAVGKNS